MHDDSAAYLRAQRDITTAIERLLVAHILSPLPHQIRLEGNGYSLHGEHKEWKYGKALQLAWGDQRVRPCKEKWSFVFNVDVQGQ